MALEALSPQTWFTWYCLPAPAGKPASFLLAGGCLQELHWFKQQYSSWLLDNSVLQGARSGPPVAAASGGITWSAAVLNPRPHPHLIPS